MTAWARPVPCINLRDSSSILQNCYNGASMSSARAETKLPIQEGVPLKPYTTFKIGGPARYFAEISTPEELRAAGTFARTHGAAIFVLGGGSNIVVSHRALARFVLQPPPRGI